MEELNEKDFEYIKNKIIKEKGWAEKKFDSEYQKYKKDLLRLIGVSEDLLPNEAIIIQFADELGIELPEYQYRTRMKWHPISEIDLEVYKRTEENDYGNILPKSDDPNKAIIGIITYIRKRSYKKDGEKDYYYRYTVDDGTGVINGIVFGEDAIWDKVKVGDYVQIWNVPIREAVEIDREGGQKIYTGTPEIGWFSTSKIEILNLKDDEIKEIGLPTIEEVFQCDTWTDFITGGTKAVEIMILQTPQVAIGRDGGRTLSCLANINIGGEGKVRQTKIYPACADKLPKDLDNLAVYRFRALARHSNENVVYVVRFLSSQNKVQKLLKTEKKSKKPKKEKSSGNSNIVIDYNTLLNNVITYINETENAGFDIETIKAELEESLGAGIDEKLLRSVLGDGVVLQYIEQIDEDQYEIKSGQPMNINIATIEDSIMTAVEKGITDKNALELYIAHMLSIDAKEVSKTIDTMINNGVLESFENNTRVKMLKNTPKNKKIIPNTTKTRENVIQFIRDNYGNDDFTKQQIEEVYDGDLSKVLQQLIDDGLLIKKKKDTYFMP